jgi:hypothetical protein
MMNFKKSQNRLLYILLSFSISACSTTANTTAIPNTSSDNKPSSNAMNSVIIGAIISAALSSSGGSSSPAGAVGAPSVESNDNWLVPLIAGVAYAIYQDRKEKSDKNIVFTPPYFSENEKEVTGEVIIVSKKGQSVLIDKALKLKERHTLRNIPLTLSLLSVDGLNQEKIKTLQKKNPSAFIQPNYYYYLDGKEDTNKSLKRKIPQYALGLIGLNDNKQQQRGKGIRIGIIDTPLDRNHPELRESNIKQKNFVVSKGKFHATALAGILVGSKRLQGIVPSAMITSVGAFEERSKSQSTGKSTSFTLAKAFDYIIGERVNVLNLSFGSTKADPLMKRLISETLKHNIKIVASVGNDGNNTTARYPAAFDGVMGITAIDSKSRLYNKANTGKAVDYALPGVNIITSKPGGRYTSISGTSFANAYAAGLIALQLSKNKNLKLLNKSTKDLGKNGKDSHFGYGLLQVPR